jgi:hypothetical protein
MGAAVGMLKTGKRGPWPSLCHGDNEKEGLELVVGPASPTFPGKGMACGVLEKSGFSAGDIC